MPAVRPATVETADLPAVATVAELAAWERCDPRTLRLELAAGKIPGGFRKGRSWRICVSSEARSGGEGGWARCESEHVIT